MRSADHPLLPCPICGRAAPTSNARFLPFCSDRCRLIDLGRWLDEEHSIPCSSAEDDEADEKFDEHSSEPGKPQRSPPNRLPPGWHDA